MGSKQHVYGTASSSQLFNYPPMDGNFTTKIIVKTFLAANIPLKKFETPHYNIYLLKWAVRFKRVVVREVGKIADGVRNWNSLTVGTGSELGIVRLF